MRWPIHAKIERELAKRRLRKKDLARQLGIAPQTMTDICKGRSAVTLAHLKGLVRYFRLRADYWLDETRSTPTPLERAELIDDEGLRLLESVLFGPRLQRARRARILAARLDPARVDNPEDRRLLVHLREVLLEIAGERGTQRTRV